MPIKPRTPVPTSATVEGSGTAGGTAAVAKTATPSIGGPSKTEPLPICAATLEFPPALQLAIGSFRQKKFTPDPSGKA